MRVEGLGFRVWGFRREVRIMMLAVAICHKLSLDRDCLRELRSFQQALTSHRHHGPGAAFDSDSLRPEATERSSNAGGNPALGCSHP